MKLGYIIRYDLNLNPDLTEEFAFKEFLYTRRISSRSDKIIPTKGFRGSFDYEEVESNTEILKNCHRVMLIGEPVFLDDELRERMVKWVELANKTDSNEYDPF